MPVALSYDDEGAGPALVFLHGGACDRSFWEPQVAHYRGRYRIVVPDLRGHGSSPVPGGEYTIESFASDVAAMVESLRIRGATVIGHRLSGLVAFALPALFPGIAGRVVALDSPLALSPEAASAFRELAEAGHDDLRHEAKTRSDAALGPGADPALAARIAAAQDATDLDAFVSLTRHVFANCHEDLLAGCDVPALSVGAIIPNDLERFGSLCSNLHVGRVVGSGHFLQLEVPDQVNAMLDRFLDLTHA